MCREGTLLFGTLPPARPHPQPRTPHTRQSTHHTHAWHLSSANSCDSLDPSHLSITDMVSPQCPNEAVDGASARARAPPSAAPPPQSALALPRRSRNSSVYGFVCGSTYLVEGGRVRARVRATVGAGARAGGRGVKVGVLVAVLRQYWLRLYGRWRRTARRSAGRST